MTIRTMSLAELQSVLEWAGDEGWNPGIDDAQAFYSADPEGFFLKLVDGQPVAAVSVVNHSDEHAFLGLYLCKPEFRGQGHGMEVWRAGRAHAGSRCVGLDGVPDQQDNYRRDGFHWHGRTTRFVGTAPLPMSEPMIPFAPGDLNAVKSLDLAATGHARDRFLEAWITPTETRRTLVLKRDGTIAAMATYRRCQTGTKIGPLYAQTQSDAHALLAARPEVCGTGPLIVDVPDASPALRTTLETFGFEPSFETARMYTGTPPDRAAPPYFGVASLELG